MKFTKDTVTISELNQLFVKYSRTGRTFQLKDADPSELQLFIGNMATSIKGKSVKCNFQNMHMPESFSFFKTSL